MNSNFIHDSSYCLKNYSEFVKIKRIVEQYRSQSSYFNFTDQHLNQSNKSDIFLSIKIFLYSIVIIFSLVGNFLIIAVTGRNKSLKRANSLFILNLAVCDLAILFSCIWVQILLAIDTNWRLGEAFCKINSFMQMVSIISSVLTLSMISCDRYIGIVHPLKAKQQNKSIYYVTVGVIWTVSVTVSLPTYLYRSFTEIKWSDFVEKNCDDSGWPSLFTVNNLDCLEKSSFSLKQIYYTIIIVFFFLLPFAIMVLAYTSIIRKLKRNQSLQMAASFANRMTIYMKQKKVFIV